MRVRECSTASRVRSLREPLRPLTPSAPPVFCSYVVAGRGESRMRNPRFNVKNNSFETFVESVLILYHPITDNVFWSFGVRLTRCHRCERISCFGRGARRLSLGLKHCCRHPLLQRSTDNRESRARFSPGPSPGSGLRFRQCFDGRQRGKSPPGRRASCPGGETRQGLRRTTRLRDRKRGHLRSGGRRRHLVLCQNSALLKQATNQQLRRPWNPRRIEGILRRRADFRPLGCGWRATGPPGVRTAGRRVQKYKRTQNRRAGAVSIVINPWRAPDLGVGGDVGDSSSPYAQGKHRPARGCHAPERKPGSRPGPHLDQNVLARCAAVAPASILGPLETRARTNDEIMPAWSRQTGD